MTGTVDCAARRVADTTGYLPEYPPLAAARKGPWRAGRGTPAHISTRDFSPYSSGTCVEAGHNGRNRSAKDMQRHRDAVIIGALALPGSPAQAAPAAPAITVEGTAPFADGQTVTVHGSGLTPGQELFVEECESAGICNVRVGGPQVVASDGTVAMTATLT